MNGSDLSTARRWGSLCSALLILIGVVLGVPRLLMQVSQWQFGSPSPWAGVARPWEWDLGRLADLFAGRMADSALTEVLIRVALSTIWIAVGLFVVNVGLEVLHQLRHDGIPSPTVRGLGWSHRVSRFVASGLLVLAPHMGLAKAASVGLPAFSAPVVAATVGQAEVPVTNSLLRHSSDWRSSDGLLSGAPVGPSTAEYVVQAGDSVFSIADRLSTSDAGAARLADSIVELNLGRGMNDGQRFTNAAYVEPGWVLRLPSAPAPPAESPARPQVHAVVAGDTLWGIAETHLDDPLRWSEIWDHNAGVEMGDGRRLERPDLIVPGWGLEIPQSPGSLDDIEPTDQILIDDEAFVDRTENAVESPVDGLAAREIIWDAGPAPSIGETSGSAEVESELQSETGYTIARDAFDVPEIDPEPSPDDLTVDSAADPLVDALATETIDVGNGQPLDHQMVPNLPERGAPLGIGSAAMLSAGVLALLGMHRRRRLRSAPPRTRLPDAAPRPLEAERALRSLDAGEQLLRIDLALRAAAGLLCERDRTVVVAMVSAGGEVELLLDGPATPVSPWVGEGTSWTLPARVSIEDLAGSARSVGLPSIALVQLGVDTRDRAVWVDLETVGHLNIDAPGTPADSVLRALAATLGSSAFAGAAHLISVGIAPEGFLGHPSVLEVASLTEAMSAAAEAVGSTAAAKASTFSLRARGLGGEAWEPAIVLAGSSASGVVGAMEPSRGVAVVTVGADQPSNATLSDHGDRWALGGPALGSVEIDLYPIGLTVEEMHSLGDLIETACCPLVTEVDESPRDAPSPSMVSSVDPELALPWSILVRLLGRVEIADRSGATAGFERSKARELITWLATHRQRATRTGARTALWELDVRDSTFANVVSEARRTMARLVPPDQGEEWLARTLTEDLPLHADVVTDADVIEHALRAARHQPAELAIAILDPAVQLIRGMPFEGTGYLWPDAEGITSNLILLATTAAVELAAHHLSQGDIEGVFRATAHGLLALPGHEELIALRMRAHAKAGDHAAVRHEWSSYERVINADPWSDGEPAPKLVALRHELLAGRS